MAQAKAAIVGAANAVAMAEARAVDMLVADPDEKAALEEAASAARRKRTKAAEVAAMDDGRVGAAKKFVGALAAGELQPMIQRANGEFAVLPPKLWVVHEHVPLVTGRDAVIVGDGCCHAVFLDSKDFRDWCRIEEPASPRARPIDLCRQQLQTWTADRQLLLREVRKWGGEGRPGKPWICRALAKWLQMTHARDIGARHIENQLRKDLDHPVRML